MKLTKLDYDKFKDYLFFKKETEEGLEYVFKFENRYGASIIKKPYSYGYEHDQFELAIIKFNENCDYNNCYTTPLATDVVSVASNELVLWYLKEIQQLEK